MQLKALLAEKVENLKSVITELKRTQKTLRFINKGTSKLDHLMPNSQSFGDHNGVGYKGESSYSKIIFVKSSLLDDSINVSIKKHVVKSIATENKSVIK